VLAAGVPELSLEPMVVVSGEVTVADRKCTPKFRRPSDCHRWQHPGVDLAHSEHRFARPIFHRPSRCKPPYRRRFKDGFKFSINVPPGEYDIYVEPSHSLTPAASCRPQLLRGQPISGGALGLNIPLPEPQAFDFHVTWPSGDGA